MGVLDIREKNDYPIEIYRKFLGPDYVPPEKFTTIVLNHTCWMVNYISKIGYFILPLQTLSWFHFKGKCKKLLSNRVHRQIDPFRLFRQNQERQ